MTYKVKTIDTKKKRWKVEEEGKVIGIASYYTDDSYVEITEFYTDKYSGEPSHHTHILSTRAVMLFSKLTPRIAKHIEQAEKEWQDAD